MTRATPEMSSETRYRLLVQAVTDYAIYMLDPNGFVVSWNAGAFHLKGYTEPEILGRHFSLFYPPEDVRSGMPVRTLATADREGRFVAEGWRLRKGGERFWASIVVEPIRSPEGELLGFAKVTRDLTERRAAEEALRRSEEQFRLLVQGVTDYAIYMIDLDGIVTNWNSGAERIKGYRPDEVIGQSFARFYLPEDREAGNPRKALERARAEGRFESEGWRVRKDGTRFWAHVVLDPITDAAGHHVGYAKVTRDVTEKRAAAAELERARETLFQSQKLDALGQLTGGIAHDFNNLLTVVLTGLTLIKRRLPDDSTLHKLVDNATQGAQRGVSLTRRLLTFARRQELVPTRVDVTVLVAGMRDMLERTLGPSIRLVEEFDRELHPVHVDAHQLELALLNLAVNARDAMPAGGRLTIAAREATLAESQSHPSLAPCVVLSVTDTGEGMSEETLGRAMEPFFTTKGVGKGTGLGLAMVHGLAVQSSGTFILKSSLGQGTTAELWLPLADAQAGATAHAPANGDPLGPNPPPRSRSAKELRVLVVDDDPLVLNATVAMLDEFGHHCRPARSGAEALLLLESGCAVDLVLTDHAMPGMTGADLALQLQQRYPGLPVVLATGFAELPPDRQSLKYRIAKPFTPEDLAIVFGDAVGDPASLIDAAAASARRH